MWYYIHDVWKLFFASGCNNTRRRGTARPGTGTYTQSQQIAPPAIRRPLPAAARGGAFGLPQIPASTAVTAGANPLLFREGRTSMRTRRIGIALALAMCIATHAASALELKISHVLSPVETMHKTAVGFGEDLEKRSNGYFKVNVYPNTEIGNPKENIEMLRRGANVVVLCDSGFLADYVPAYGAMVGPYLFKNWREIVKLGKSDWHKNLQAQCSEKGIKVLCMDWLFGRRSVMSDKAIVKPGDLKGMKIRTPPNNTWIATITAMGGQPTVLPWSEVYSALSQKVVDGTEAPLSTLYGSKIYEVKKKLSLTRHFTAQLGLIMSQKLFDGIPADQQKILLDTVDEWSIKCCKAVERDESEWQKKLVEQGVEVNEADLDAFTDACKAVYDTPGWSWS